MTSAMTAIACLLAAGAALPLSVFAIEVLFGLFPGRRQPPARREVRVTILIPAHDEAEGIGATLAELQQIAPLGTRVLVVADNCTDDTASNARLAGAEVAERQDPAARGKGYALAFGRDYLLSGTYAPPDAILVLDADCRLSHGSVETLAAAALANHAPVQAINLISPDLSAAPMVQISSFAMLVKNFYRSRGMQRMGGAALLTGTGMAFPWSLFADAELATGSIVEDLALGIEMTRAGKSPRLVETAQVRSAPADLRDALQQRTRWEHGFLQVLRQHAFPLVIGGMRRASLSEILLGLHLLVPPLALLLLLSAVDLVLLVAFAVTGASSIPATILGALLSLVLLLVLIAWIAGGRPYLSGSALLRAPFYVLWKIPVYAGYLRKPEAQWKRTHRRP